MATFVCHRFDEVPKAMHPFFPPVDQYRRPTRASREDPAEHQGSTLQTSDGNLLLPASRDGMSAPNPGFDTPSIFITTSTPNSPIDAPFDAQPCADRWKRRCITPVGDDSLAPVEVDRSLQNTSWKTQLEEAAALDHTSQASDLSSANLDGAPSAKEDEKQGVLVPLKRKARRTPGKAKPKPNVHGDDTTTSSDTSQIRLGSPAKVIKLSGNGKLLQSPKRVVKDRAITTKVAAAKSTMKLKQGRMVPALVVVLKYNANDERRVRTGQEITKIMSSRRSSNETGHAEVDPGTLHAKSATTTHPFFLGKLAQKPGLKLAISVSDVSSKGQESDTENRQSPGKQEPVPWKDMVFAGTVKSQSKSFKMLDPIWPPHDLQHIGSVDKGSHHGTIPKRKEVGKHKHRVVHLDAAEDVLRCFAQKIRTQYRYRHISCPHREILSGRDMANRLDADARAVGVGIRCTDHPAVSTARRRLKTSYSAFDHGVYAGPSDWPHQYAPSSTEEVLQSQIEILHHWLSSLQVHETKMRKNAEMIGKTKRRKKKLKRHGNDLDDFIASSEDEGDVPGVKNGILITGPTGCGKTASVFAVAKQLGFEVFEINPGMRRSAKDIFDRVGDMTRNHLVQKTAAGVNVTDDVVSTESEDEVVNKKTKTLGGLFGAKQSKESPHREASGPKKSQKQSLILLEEVDILFEDDRAFWTGVQALIEQSRRPVIMTCNDPSTVPVDLLNLHATLTYTAPDVDAATELLTYVAAAEGHILTRQSMSTLYSSKGKDLRASLMELNLWCQMAVGSALGGLDWMNHSTKRASDGLAITSTNRIFSHDTFTTGIDILPELQDEQEMLSYMQNQLDLGVQEWEWSQMQNEKAGCDLIHFSALAETRSCLDLYDDSVAALVSGALTKALPDYHSSPIRDQVLCAYQRQGIATPAYQKEIMGALEPLQVEKLTFPPSQGRLAPSLDLYNTSIAADIAPYVRAIVAFDKQLELQRDVLEGGSQGKKARRTRAAMAALEGGSKSSTRRERWFPKVLDFDQVLHTGGEWPLWDEEHEQHAESPISQQA